MRAVSPTPISTPVGGVRAWRRSMRILMLGFVMAAFANAASPQSSSPATGTRNDLIDFRPGQTFRDCPEGPQVVVIPAGTFVIASPPNKKDRWEYEGPRRPGCTRRLA